MKTALVLEDSNMIFTIRRLHGSCHGGRPARSSSDFRNQLLFCDKYVQDILTAAYQGQGDYCANWFCCGGECSILLCYIAVLTDVLQIIPYVFGSVYNASKAALHSWSDSLRVELAPFG